MSEQPIGTPVEKSEWDEAIDDAAERMANQIKEEIDNDVVESVIDAAQNDGVGIHIDPPQETAIANLSDVLDGNIRQENELYCDYRCRLFWEKYLRKQYLNGRTIWKSRERGEARNMERKNRNSKLRRKKDAYNARLRELSEQQGKRTIDELNTTRKSKERMRGLVK